MNYFEPTYKEIHQACLDMANEIEQRNLDLDYVVALCRGGAIPGVILSHMLNLPLIMLDYSSTDGKGDDKNHSNDLIDIASGSSFLLVDDIADSGKTIKEITEHYGNPAWGCQIYTAVLYYKSPSEIVRPHFVWRNITPSSPWVVFPWEITIGL